AAKRADAPGHPGPVDHVTDQQQFGDQDGQLLTGQPRVSGWAHLSKNRFDYVIKSTMSIVAGQMPGRSVRPTRRTSAPPKRRDDTRAGIIDETVRCSVEEGFAAATAKHVAERAGVTWGVIQYHFGDRNGLLMAVVDDGVDRLIESLSSADVSELPLRERIEGVADPAWAGYTSPTPMGSCESRRETPGA